MVKTMRNSECGMRNSKVRSWRTRLALLFRIPHSTFHIEGKPHPRLLPHEPPHLKRREGREDRARVDARGRDQLVYVPRLGGERVPQRPFERLEIGGHRPCWGGGTRGPAPPIPAGGAPPPP